MPLNVDLITFRGIFYRGGDYDTPLGGQRSRVKNGCKTVQFFAKLFCEKSEIFQFFNWKIVSNFLNEPKGESQKNTRVKSERNSNEPKGEIRLSLRWNRSERMRRLARILTRNGVADEPRGEPTLYFGKV